jgi:hypothetical protein
MNLRTLGIGSEIPVFSTILLMSGNVLDIKKTVAICISLLFILLLALQLNSPGFTPAFAQLGGPNRNNNLNLTGIWERIDEYPWQSLVYINHEGSNITATFEPIGYCWEDPYNKIEGTQFSSQKLEFRGNLVDNTIQGEQLQCFPDTRTTGLWDLTLTVSTDARTLVGNLTSPDGQRYNTQYVFVSDIIPSSIEINTDREVYDFGESVEISGQVTNIVNEEPEVFIEVYRPNGEQVFSNTVVINSDGSFFTRFGLSDQINNGTYTAVASYAGANDQITFEIQQRDDAPIPTQDSETQITDVPTRSTESKPTLQVQCIQTPVFPQANQNITFTASVLDEWAAPKVADSIEIEIEIRATNSNRIEPVIMSENIDSSSRLNYTIGPFANLTTISYGCRAIDNSTSTSVFSGMKNMVIGGDFNEVIGSFNESRAVSVPYTGNSSSHLDILFIADNKTFSGPNDPDFLIDVETAIRAYYNQSILLEHQNKTNFWIAQDMGQARSNCEIIPPVNWDSEYFSFEGAVILHRDDSIRDCTRPGTEISTANMATLAKEGYLVLHELGHRPFGLADEYDNPSVTIISHPYENIYNNKQECENVLKELLVNAECRKIPYIVGTNEFYTFDPKPNDLMVDNRQFQVLDIRRIENWFEECLTPDDNIPRPTKDHCKGGE